jgi:hypothetical protein
MSNTPSTIEPAGTPQLGGVIRLRDRVSRLILVSPFSYVGANLWSLVPAVAAVILLFLAHAVASISITISCDSEQAIGSNWLICGDSNIAMNRLFLNRLDSPDSYVDDLKNQILSIDNIAKNAASDRGVTYKTAVDKAGADKAAVVKAGADKAAADKAAADKRAADEATATTTAMGKISGATLTAAREGKGRLVWIASAGILLIVSIAGVFGSLYLSYDALAGHALAVAANGREPVRKIFALGTTVVVASLLAALLSQLYFGWLFGLNEFDFFWGIRFLENPNDALPSDGLTHWWMQIKDVSRIHHAAVVWATLALFGLMALVTSTLHQGPADPDFRNNPAPGSQLDDDANIRYRRYMGRSFARLRYGIYLGAALLAVVVAETAARRPFHA